MLLSHPTDGWILVDVGPGEKDPPVMEVGPLRGRSSLIRDLRELGVGAKDIGTVVLTHLYADHAGGATYATYSGRVMPTFPNAQYMVQREAWEEACHPNERADDVHRSENFLPIDERGQLELLDGDSEIFPGLNVVVTDGHALGHQMVMFNHGGERVVFLGDIVPTPHHLNLVAISAFDSSPEVTLEQKKELLNQAERQGWLLVFSHGHDIRAGYLERRGEMGFLRPVDL